MTPLHLLTPFQLGDLHLKNRVILAPMTRARDGTARLANALMAEYYRQRSSAGLLITEAITISSQANGWNESRHVHGEDAGRVKTDSWGQPSRPSNRVWPPVYQ